MNIEANTRAGHRKITMLVPDMDGVHKAENIIMNVVRAREEDDFEYIKEAIAKCIMTRAMEGDAAAGILTYLSTREVVNGVFVVRALCGQGEGYKTVWNNMSRCQRYASTNASTSCRRKRRHRVDTRIVVATKTYKYTRSGQL